MQWLISNSEPRALHAPVLSEELLRRGIVRGIVDLMPWYKKTRNMELILAGHLTHVLRSGFADAYIRRQMVKLDIPEEAAERLLKALDEGGVCRFGEPQYLYNPVVHSARFGGRAVVQSQYLRTRVVISDTLATCLQLLGERMPREAYLRRLEEYMGSGEYAQTACHSLAQVGLILSGDGGEASVSDYGPLRWNLEITGGGEFLDAAAWDRRLDFLQDSFQQFFFQSHGLFPSPPVGLCGDYHVARTKGGADYFWEVSFKLQRFSNRVPVNLRISSPFSGEGWREFRLRAPMSFNWHLTFDLRGSDRSADELAAFLRSDHYSDDTGVTVLCGRELPPALASAGERVNFRLYFSGGAPTAVPPDSPHALRGAVGRALLPFLRREGCGAALSLYINDRGEVYSCPLEGGIRLGCIGDGAKAVEQRREALRCGRQGACLFGSAPGGGREPDRAAGLTPLQREAVGSVSAPRGLTCP